MNTKVKEFFNKAEGKEFATFEDMLQFGKDNAKVYDCIALHLDENMQPDIQLRNTDECSNKEMCGKCNKCDYMVDVLTEDGAIFSYGVYNVVCAY